MPDVTIDWSILLLNEVLSVMLPLFLPPTVAITQSIPAPKALMHDSPPSSGVYSQDAASSLNIREEVPISFKSALDFCADRLKITIISEGSPMSDSLGSKEAEKAQKALLQARSSSELSVTKDALKLIAGLYDYSAEEYGPHIVLLRKRYTDVSDLPVVSYDEYFRSLREILRVTGAYCPVKAIPELLARPVYNSFLAAGLTEPFENVPLSNFPIAQQEALREYTIRTYLDFPTMHADFALQHLMVLKERNGTRCAFQYMDFRGLPAFGYEAPFGVKRRMIPFILSHGMVSLPSGGTRTTIPKGTFAVGKSVSPVTDPFDPFSASASLQSRLSFVPLESLFDKQGDKHNQAQTTISMSSPSIVVDKIFAKRAVSISGANYASQVEIAEAICKAFGFRLIKEEHKEVYSISPARIPQMKSVRDLTEIVQQLMPEPALRAMHMAGTLSKEMEKNFLDSAGSDRVLQDWLQGDNPAQRDIVRRLLVTGNRNQQPDAQYREAARRLRVLIEPRIRAKSLQTGIPEKDCKLAMSELGDQEWNLIAVLAASDAMSKLLPLTSETQPEYISEWDASKITVTGGSQPDPSGNLSIFGMMLKFQTGTGRKVTVPIVNIRIPISR